MGVAILKIETQAQPQFFALLKCRARWVALVAPDGRIHWKSLARFRDALVCDDTDALREQMELDWLSMWTVILLALIPIPVVAVRAQGYLTGWAGCY